MIFIAANGLVDPQAEDICIDGMVMGNFLSTTGLEVSPKSNAVYDSTGTGKEPSSR